MTVQTTTNKANFIGTGSMGPFTFTFRFFDNNEIVVKKTVIATGVITTLTEGGGANGYTLTGAGDYNGGSLTLVTALGNGTERLTIRRVVGATQDTDLRNQGAYFAEIHEDEFDKLVMVQQQHDEVIARSIAIPEVDTGGTDVELPTAGLRANKALVFDADGNVTVSADDYEDQAANAAASAAAAATSAANAATSESNAATSASNAATSASNAATSASSASASATAAQAAADAVMWNDVVFKTAADSPIAITNADAGKLYAIDCTAGAVTVNLPQISGLVFSEPWSIGFRKTDASANAITINRAGTDTIDGSASTSISTPNVGKVLVPDTDPSPDQWVSMQFGTELADGSVTTAKLADGVVDGLSVVSPATADHFMIADASDSNKKKKSLISALISLVFADVAQPVPVRQTVLSGPVDAAGISAFGGATGSTTVTASGTLKATASAGGDANRTGSITNPSWTGLSTNGTMYLYLDIAADGTVTTGSTTLEPTYQWGGTYSTTNGQNTYNIQEAIMKAGNGSVASQVYRVFVGKVTVAAGVVSAITWYALMGRYDSGLVATLPGASTAVSQNHNLGVRALQKPTAYLECITTDNGYAVGDRLTEWSSANGSYDDPNPIWWSSLSCGFGTNASVAFRCIPKGGGNGTTALTAANWKYGFFVQRGW